MTRTLPRLTRFLVLLALVGCTGGGTPQEPEISGAWARPRSVGPGAAVGQSSANTAVYLKILNTGPVAFRLLGGETPAATGVEVHQTVMDGDVARMRRVDGVDIDPGETVRLEPGGLHLMLLGLRRSLQTGDTLTLFLTFHESPPVTVRVPVADWGGA